MIGFNLANALLSIHYLACQGIRLVQLDKILQLLEIMCKFHRMGLDIQLVQIYAGFAVPSTSRLSKTMSIAMLVFTLAF